MKSRRRQHAAHSLKSTPGVESPTSSSKAAIPLQADQIRNMPPAPRPRMTEDEALEYIMSQPRTPEPVPTDEELAERRWQLENKGRVIFGRSSWIVSSAIHGIAVVSLFVSTTGIFSPEIRHVASGAMLAWPMMLWVSDRLQRPKVRPNTKVIAAYAACTIVCMGLISLLNHGIG